MWPRSCRRSRNTHHSICNSRANFDNHYPVSLRNGHSDSCSSQIVCNKLNCGNRPPTRRHKHWTAGHTSQSIGTRASRDNPDRKWGRIRRRRGGTPRTLGRRRIFGNLPAISRHTPSGHSTSHNMFRGIRTAENRCIPASTHNYSHNHAQVCSPRRSSARRQTQVGPQNLTCSQAL